MADAMQGVTGTDAAAAAAAAPTLTPGAAGAPTPDPALLRDAALGSLRGLCADVKKAFGDDLDVAKMQHGVTAESLLRARVLREQILGKMSANKDIDAATVIDKVPEVASLIQFLRQYEDMGIKVAKDHADSLSDLSPELRNHFKTEIVPNFARNDGYFDGMAVALASHNDKLFNHRRLEQRVTEQQADAASARGDLKRAREEIDALTAKLAEYEKPGKVARTGDVSLVAGASASTNTTTTTNGKPADAALGLNHLRALGAAGTSTSTNTEPVNRYVKMFEDSIRSGKVSAIANRNYIGAADY